MVSKLPLLNRLLANVSNLKNTSMSTRSQENVVSFTEAPSCFFLARRCSGSRRKERDRGHIEDGAVAICPSRHTSRALLSFSIPVHDRHLFFNLSTRYPGRTETTLGAKPTRILPYLYLCYNTQHNILEVESSRLLSRTKTKTQKYSKKMLRARILHASPLELLELVESSSPSPSPPGR